MSRDKKVELTDEQLMEMVGGFALQDCFDFPRPILKYGIQPKYGIKPQLEYGIKPLLYGVQPL